jgi:hypothetical protein
MRMKFALAWKSSILGADITHRGAQTAGELMQHVRHRPLVGHLAFDAFGHELERVFDVRWKYRSAELRHRADRAHAAIRLIGPAR